MTPYSETLHRIRLAGLIMILIGTALSISLIGIGTGVYAAALAVTLLTPSRALLPAPPFVPLTAAILCGLLYSMWISAYPAQSWQGFWKYACAYLAFYAAYETLRTSGERRRIVIVFLVCSAVVALSGIGQDWIGRDFLLGRLPVHYTDAITRITGPFKHCNDFATFLLPGLLLSFAAALVALKERRKLAGALACLTLLLTAWALTRTMSRAAMIGAAAGLVFLAFRLPYRRWVLGALAAAGAAAWLVPSPISARLHKLLDLNVDMRERIVLIEGTVKMIQDAPWFGLGLNTYSKWFPIYNPADTTAPILMYAHNSYLQMMAEAGVVGLALYLAYVLLVLRRAAVPDAGGSESPADAWVRPGLAAAVIAVLVNALFESLLQSSQLRTLLWCLLGLAAARCVKGAR